MTEGKNIQSWVQKAVADVAAFGGFSRRRIDTKAERMAIGALLANANLTEDDREYIEGFMLDRSAKSEKIDGKKPRRNKERSVEIPAGPMYAQSFDELNEIADTREKLKLFFDDKGRVVRNELKGKDGEFFVLNKIHYINDEESEITTEQRMPGGVTTTSKVRYNNKAGRVAQMIDMVMKKDDKIIQEQHTMEDGTFVDRKYKELSELNQYAFHFPKISDLDFDYEKVTVFEQTYKDGNVTGRYIDKEGNVLATIQGTYTQNQFGNLVPQYPSDEQDIFSEEAIKPVMEEVAKESIRQEIKKIPEVLENIEESEKIIANQKEKKRAAYEKAIQKLMNKQGLSREEAEKIIANREEKKRAAYEEAFQRLMNERGLSREEAEKELVKTAGMGSTIRVPEMASSHEKGVKYMYSEESGEVRTFDTKEERDKWLEQRKKAVKSTDKDYDNKAFDKDVKKKEE